MISIEIGELVLRGFPSGDRYRIAESVATELAVIVRGGDVTDAPRSVSEQIARAVYEAVQDA